MALEDNASVHSVLTQPVDGLVRDGGAESACAALKDLGTEADPRVRHGSLRTVLLEQPGERQPAQLRHNAHHIRRHRPARFPGKIQIHSP
jgi:hypothetical protein